MPAPPPPDDVRRLWPSFAGMALLAAMLFVTLASAGAVGTGPVLALTALWVVLLGLGLRWFVRRPWLALAVPVVDLAAWLAVVFVAR